MLNATTHTLPSPIATRFRHMAVFKAAAEFAATVIGVLGARRTGSENPTRLYTLSDHVLRDIGLSRAQIGAGPAESFWRD